MWYRHTRISILGSVSLRVSEWRGSDKLPRSWWPDVAPTPRQNKTGVTGICRDILGTDGLTYPPFINKELQIWLFISDLCR